MAGAIIGILFASLTVSNCLVGGANSTNTFNAKKHFVTYRANLVLEILLSFGRGRSGLQPIEKLKRQTFMGYFFSSFSISIDIDLTFEVKVAYVD